MNIVNLDIECVYINSHSKGRENVDLNTGKILCNIVKQVGKNGVPIDFYRVVIPYKTGYNLIMNLYKNKQTGKLYGKTLTVLTDNQLSSSRNMNMGKLEPYKLNLLIKEVKHQEMFFDDKFIDFLNQPKD